MHALILGGARSGKSRFAEEWAKRTQQSVVYVATATAQDSEMADRIAYHRADRPEHWQTHEVPLQLAEHLQSIARPQQTLIVDCLTLWLTNLLCAEHLSTDQVEQEINQLFEVLPTLPGTVLLVSNEVGLGVVPMGELTRRYVDESGRLHQALAQHCDPVVLMVAGLPHYLKGEMPCTP